MIRKGNGFPLAVAALLLVATGLRGQNTAIQVRHLYSIRGVVANPIRIAADGSGKVYVADAFRRTIYVFAGESVVDSLEPNLAPLALSRAGSGLLALTDRRSGGLQLLDPASGQPKAAARDTLFQLPAGVTSDDAGNFYVVDSKARKVVVLGPDLTVVREFGEDVLIFPVDVAFDPVRRRIYVTEQGGLIPEPPPPKSYMVHAFDLSGNYLGGVVEAGFVVGTLTRAQGLCVDDKGRLFVTDPFQATVSIFDPDGTYLTQFGGFGTEPGRLRLPMDVAIDDAGRIWVASMNNSALEVYGLEETATGVADRSGAGGPEEFRLLPNYPNPFHDGTWIPFELAGSERVAAMIYDAMGRRIREYRLGELSAGRYDGGRSLYWDGRDAEGRLAPAGIYFVELRVGATVLRRKMVLMR